MKNQIQKAFALAVIITVLTFSARAYVAVTPTMDPGALQTALNATNLTITGVSIINGVSGQVGTYTAFTNPPITIGDGIVLSTGYAVDVVGPADPELMFPAQSTDMTGLGTTEFDAYGAGHIQGWKWGSYDVAALEVDFHLTNVTSVKFDFVFGSVEYPEWTSYYTDALLVFLDGTDPTNQIAFDKNGQPVQVGDSFAGLVAIGDQNTAFANPHGMLLKMTTTTASLPAGDHKLIFEVGDVNDGLLDSAAFIANLRAGQGDEGTEPVEGPPTLSVTEHHWLPATNWVGLTWKDTGVASTIEQANSLKGPWNAVSNTWTTNGSWLGIAVGSTNTAQQFFRLRKDN